LRIASCRRTRHGDNSRLEQGTGRTSPVPVSLAVSQLTQHLVDLTCFMANQRLGRGLFTWFGGPAATVDMIWA